MKCEDPWALSSHLLLQVSRTFALNINVLPGQKRKELLISYLYCRMADTVEDDPFLESAEKDKLLRLFREIFAVEKDQSETLGAQKIEEFVQALPQSWKESDDWNHILCVYPLWSIQLFWQQDTEVRKEIARTIDIMTRGMAQYAERQEKAGAWMSLDTVQELEEYCYYVAGVVGELITVLFSRSPLVGKKRRKKMEDLSVSFGLALQLTNILKDAEEDHHRGICYLPEELAQKEGISTKDLFLPENLEAGRKVVEHLVDKTWKHLEDALEYTLLLPRLEYRMRLFCLWPLMMAAETLAAIGDGSSTFKKDYKVKIDRAQVKKILKKTTLICYSNLLLKRYFLSIQKKGHRGNS
jgi:farnesyl-diphosphate farnesyltransferase